MLDKIEAGNERQQAYRLIYELNKLIGIWPGQEPTQVKLPLKITAKEPDQLSSAVYTLNQLIDFCESLQARVKELENE